MATEYDKLRDVTDELSFIPSEAQRRLKIKFWQILQDDPSVDPTRVTLAQALQLTGDNRLNRWWKIHGFSAWFQGKDEWREEAEYLCHLAQVKAREILESDDPRAVNAKVSLIKALFEAGGKISKGKEVKLLDEGVQKMNKAQLEDILRKAKLLSGGTQDAEKENTE